MQNLSKSYYLKPVKIIRDLVHGYINLTRFDLDLIDTIEFQRLNDIRQLTCQHVYPAARHTRFEHSLGVLELMRNAIRHLNRNGILGRPLLDSKKPIITESMEFSAAVAALLHDVGHCPFSHMGETEFEKAAVRKALANEVKSFSALKDCKDLIETLDGTESAGAVHEQLSCIVILRKYKDLLSDLKVTAKLNEEPCELETDFELIIRSILGVEYKIDAAGKEKEQIKNIIVRLLNSKIFDVDKLDYVMRDSQLTGIGTPSVDTQRLFRNMYLDDKYYLVFTSKAVPALQNMIDARDGLYLYVYNHHAVVYSDFLNTYISRRLYHNAKSFFQYAYPEMSEQEIEEALTKTPISPQMFRLGLVPKTYLFSVNAVAVDLLSDCVWLSLLHNIHSDYCEADEKKVSKKSRDIFTEQINEALGKLDPIPAISLECNKDDKQPFNKEKESKIYTAANDLSPEDMEKLIGKIADTKFLIHQSMRRRYLKPWWKTVFEFSNFMNHHFRDDRLRQDVGTFICNGGKHGLKADEIRSQIAKHVVYITQKLEEDKRGGDFGLVEKLRDGEFFVVQRSTNFFSTDTIEKLEIALKDSEILGPPSADVSRRVDKYYLKKLTNIIPQKNYSSIYAKEGFYVFSKRPSQKSLADSTNSTVSERTHYDLLEKIFVYVTTTIVKRGELDFVTKYQGEDHANKEDTSKKELYEGFMEVIDWAKRKE